jgi:hypothetical protein
MGPFPAPTTLPEFSNGWVQNFKNRHSIKSRVRHSEAASVDVNAEEEMKGMQLLILQYKEEDCYNMDETGLY